MRNSNAIWRHPRLRVGLLVLAIAGFATASGIASATAPEGDVVGANSPNAIPNSYIVVLKTAAASDVAGKARSLATQFSGRVDRTYGSALRGFAASMTATQARRLAAHADVDYVQQNQTIRLDTTQNNPPSWGLDRIDQRNCRWTTTYTLLDYRVRRHAYVIDSGIRSTHSEFGGRATAGIDIVLRAERPTTATATARTWPARSAALLTVWPKA